jgi:DNA repair protein RecO (recombination protein O)
MMIVKTEAVVLRSTKYRESSKILALYTREHGKMSVIAKGCRGARNKFGSSLEPMSYVQAVLYKKEGRELQLLSQCDLVKAFSRVPEDMERLYAALTIVALLDKVAHPEEKNEPLFESTVAALQTINNATLNAANVLYKYEMDLLGYLGYTLNFKECVSCGAPLERVATAGLKLERGGVLCASCTGKQLTDGVVSGSVLHLLQRFQVAADIGNVMDLSLDREQRAEVRNLLYRYLRRHVEGLERLRTEAVFASVLPG